MFQSIGPPRHAAAAISVALCSMFFAAPPVEAYYKPNVEPGSEMLMMDLRWPFLAKGTFFSVWNGRFHPRGGRFYGGFTTRGPGDNGTQPPDADHRPGMPWTFWGSEDYKGRDVRNVYVGDWINPSGSGAEGSMASAGGRTPFLRAGSWFTVLQRVWSPVEGGAKFTYVGSWIKDIERDRWYLVAVFRIPCKLTGFTDNSTFVEPLAPPNLRRSIHVRRVYSRRNAKWHSASRIDLLKSKKYHTIFTTIEDDTVFCFDYPVKLDKEPPAIRSYNVKQPDRPTLDKGGIENAEALVCGKQLAVRWQQPAGAAPQLCYKVEAFSRPDAKGRHVATKKENLPFVHRIRLDAPGEVRSVKLTLRDIFDAETSLVVPVKPAELMKGQPLAAEERNGVAYEFYAGEGKEKWESLPDFTALGRAPTRAGHIPAIDDNVREGLNYNYAIRYTGYLKVPTRGFYLLELKTCDGSQLLLNGKVVAGRDGLHTATTERYLLALDEGKFPLEFRYFKRSGGVNYRGRRLALSWAGPGFPMRSMNSSDFLSGPAAHLPNVGIEAVLDDTLPNRVTVSLDLDMKNQTPSRTDIFCGALKLGSLSGDARSLSTLMPAGEHQLCARLWYDNGKRSVDSKKVTVKAVNPEPKGRWLYERFGTGHLPLGLQTNDTGSALAMTGEGSVFAYRMVEGDFSIGGRIKELTTCTKENGLFAADWMGLYAKKKLDKRSVPERTAFFGLYRTAGKGLRGTPDWPDLGGGGHGSFKLPDDRAWLRLEKRGNVFRSFTSADGKSWVKATEHITHGWPKTLPVGVIFRSNPGKSRTFFHAAMDHIKLVTGELPAEVAPVKVAGDDLGGDKRFMAVVQSIRAPKTFYARSRQNGLYKSVDGGKKWSAVNGNVTSKESLTMRSVAVHPDHPDIVLRGGGYAREGKLVSGLWKSIDGGKSWRLVSTEIDFDGSGPTAFFGEVISFNPRNPELVSAAGESSGLFTSTDGGDTWKYVALRGARVSCLGYSPYVDGLLQAGGIANSEFTALGLGQPSIDLPKQTEGTLWTSRRAGRAPSVKVSARNFGITNLAFDIEKWGFLHVAATRGLYNSYSLQNLYLRRDTRVPEGCLYTGIGGSLRIFKAVKYGRGSSYVYAAPFSSAARNPVLVTDSWGRTWSWCDSKASVAVKLNCGISGICADVSNKKRVLLCNREGIHLSEDAGKSWQLVLPSMP